MFSQSPTIAAVVAVLCATVAAAPSAIEERALPNLYVMVRSENATYVRSVEQEERIRANHVAGIEKRGHATVAGCTADCSNCYPIYDGNTETSTPCYVAIAAQCLIISNLDNTHVVTWNGNNCDGNLSNWFGCGQPPQNEQTPGTNSLGIHMGC